MTDGRLKLAGNVKKVKHFVLKVMENGAHLSLLKVGGYINYRQRNNLHFEKSSPLGVLSSSSSCSSPSSFTNTNQLRLLSHSVFMPNKGKTCCKAGFLAECVYACV